MNQEENKQESEMVTHPYGQPGLHGGSDIEEET
jgi:hypothetical protein